LLLTPERVLPQRTAAPVVDPVTAAEPS
jgi:hypothetical protein